MGRDKAFIEIDGVPLWRRQLRILQELVPTEIFLAGPPHPVWENAGCTIVPDAQEECGPLGGIVAALRVSSSDLLLALAIDLPHMSANCLREILGRCADGKGVIPWDERYEPLAAVYPKRSLQLAEQLLFAGDYSLQSFANACVREELAVQQPVSSADAALFLNMNTSADLLAAAR
jgi:molybdopterin-guanine dinucleotide biosynthesis protein A